MEIWLCLNIARVWNGFVPDLVQDIRGIGYQLSDESIVYALTADLRYGRPQGQIITEQLRDECRIPVRVLCHTVGRKLRYSRHVCSAKSGGRVLC